MQQQAMQKAAEAGLAAVAAAPADHESRGERLVTTAATAWPVSPNSEGAGGVTAANVVEAASNPVQLIDPKQSNEVNRVAAATYQPSWIAYLVLLLAAALVAASTAIWIRHLAAMRIATP
jgi:hypothetical protein